MCRRSAPLHRVSSQAEPSRAESGLARPSQAEPSRRVDARDGCTAIGHAAEKSSAGETPRYPAESERIFLTDSSAITLSRGVLRGRERELLARGRNNNTGDWERADRASASAFYQHPLPPLLISVRYATRNILAAIASKFRQRRKQSHLQSCKIYAAPGN